MAILAVGATGLNLLFSTSLFKIDPGPTGLYGGIALATMATVVIVRRWLIAPARERRELLPVLVAGLVFLAVLIINLARRITDVPEDVGVVLIAARDLAPAAIPVALLIGFYRQSERRLRAIVDAIPDRMVRFDRDGEYVAGTLEPVEGHGEPDLPVGRRLHEAMFGVARADAIRAAADALETGRLQAFDFVLDLRGRATRTRGPGRPEWTERGHRDHPRLHAGPRGRGGGSALAGADRGGDRSGAATPRARPPRWGAAAARLGLTGAAATAGAGSRPTHDRMSTRSPRRTRRRRS